MQSRLNTGLNDYHGGKWFKRCVQVHRSPYKENLRRDKTNEIPREDYIFLLLNTSGGTDGWQKQSSYGRFHSVFLTVICKSRWVSILEQHSGHGRGVAFQFWPSSRRITRQLIARIAAIRTIRRELFDIIPSVLSNPICRLGKSIHFYCCCCWCRCCC